MKIKIRDDYREHLIDLSKIKRVNVDTDFTNIIGNVDYDNWTRYGYCIKLYGSKRLLYKLQFVSIESLKKTFNKLKKMLIRGWKNGTY